MTRMFKRAVDLTIARPLKGKFFGEEPNAIEVVGLRVAFTIEKNIGKEPNSAEVEVSNLSEHTRAELQRKPLHVRLSAGYEGNVERLFTGDLRHAASVREGADWLTRLELGDGERAYRQARISRSFKSGINTRTVLKEAVKSMGLKMPTSVEDAKELGKQFASGVSLQGPSQREITRMLKPAGFSWSIQDGRFQALKEGQARPDQAVVISGETGMLGSPEFSPPDKEGEAPTLRVRTLLRPLLTPGALVRVEARDISGTFRMSRVRHTGDTHGPDWSTEVEAHPL